MRKVNIGIIDSELNNLYLLKKFKTDVGFDKLYYYNCFLHESADELSQKNIEDRVNKGLDFLLSKDIDLLLVLGNEVIEHSKRKLESISVNYIVYSDCIIDYINNNYPSSNIAFFAKEEVARANIYQKNINYAHLYSVNTDRLEKAALMGEIKTDLSFSLVKEELRNLNHRVCDLVLFTSINSSMFTSELSQYASYLNLVDPYPVLMKSVDDALVSFRLLNKGKDVIIINNDVDLDMINNILDFKYKVEDIVEISNGQN